MKRFTFLGIIEIVFILIVLGAAGWFIIALAISF